MMTTLRGLLDQGSQVSLATEDAAQRLRLPRKTGSAIVSGVGAYNASPYIQTTNFELKLWWWRNLRSDDEYTIYLVTPTQSKRQGRLKLVEPSLKYIAINFIKKTYTGITETTLNNALNISKINSAVLPDSQSTTFTTQMHLAKQKSKKKAKSADFIVMGHQGRTVQGTGVVT